MKKTPTGTGTVLVREGSLHGAFDAIRDVVDGRTTLEDGMREVVACVKGYRRSGTSRGGSSGAGTWASHSAPPGDE